MEYEKKIGEKINKKQKLTRWLSSALILVNFMYESLARLLCVNNFETSTEDKKNVAVA